MTNREHEEFYTPEDYKMIGEQITMEELEEVNGHCIQKIEKQIYFDDSDKEIDKTVDLDESKEAAVFFEIEKAKKEMKDNFDDRHLFFIPKGTLITNHGGNFFRGNLNKNILAVIDKDNKNCFDLKLLNPEDKIQVSFYSKMNGQMSKNISEKSKIDHRGIFCIDLNKVNSIDQFCLALKAKR